ncbi:minor tail protein [Gordonia phage GodonK]|uniref:Minor tail protein n=1 Tax=Gordonia phage GodonK TaxID=2562192 RepID=A0A4D6E259_9CAUD|nr:minor tail protein [Gordonia phage GodonK]QBZ72707.1 minor tail protein [Gordonia phage GodonK]
MPVLGPSAGHQVRMQLIRRDRTPNSPTYGQNLKTIEVYGDATADGVCLMKGFSGLMHAPRSHVKDSWAYQEGVTLSDFPRVDERIVDLKLATKGKSPQDWENVESNLWDVLGFKEDAVLRVTFNGKSRELNVRLERKPDDAMDYFPGETKYMIWNITLIACDPWWYSNTLSSSWTRGATVADGSGWYNGAVNIINPADQDCWLEWSNREITVAEQWKLPDANAKYPTGHVNAGQQVMHTLPNLGVGKSFLVQTHPLRETLMVMDNSLEWAKMRAEDFVFPLAAKTNNPITVPVALKGGTTDSKVTVFMVQRHDRPWGD